MAEVSAATNSAREQIATFVLMKTLTTGNPWEQRNRTKIVELFCEAVNRNDLKVNGATTDNAKTFHRVLNPRMTMQNEVSQASGLYDDDLRNSPTFKEISEELFKFLAEQPKPVCLVAQNGNSFDFKMLIKECNDIRCLIKAQTELPEGLLCVDFKIAFQKLLKNEPGKKSYGLLALYERFCGENADPKRANEYVTMLRKCIMQRQDFLGWADGNCQLLMNIKPFPPAY